MRSLPDRGDGHVAALSSEYDLFVNATYMSTLLPRSRRAAYLCFFPTPFDHDLSAWRKAAIRTLGPWLTSYRGSLAMGWGTGWYPPEGGRLRQWTWTNGDAILRIEPGVRHEIRLDLGRPGMAEPVQLVVEDDTGEVLATLTASRPSAGRWSPCRTARTAGRLHFRSKTAVPGPQDARGARGGGVPAAAGRRRRARAARAAGRPLPVAAARPARRRVPVQLRHRDGQLGVHPRLDPPALADRRGRALPADPGRPAAPASQRDEVVLSVGRFFAPGLGHAKRQLEMVQMFGRLQRSGQLPGWSMTVLGGCEPFQRPYLEQVRAAADGPAGAVVPNAPRPVVEQAMSTASIFWSATGYGEDEERAPWAHEHFGMTTAEAMAGGCVPVVIDEAGQREIVRDGDHGYRWSDPDELADRTLRVANDPELRARMSAASVLRAQEYSDEAFARRWREVVAAHDLLGRRVDN